MTTRNETTAPPASLRPGRGRRTASVALIGTAALCHLGALGLGDTALSRTASAQGAPGPSSVFDLDAHLGNLPADPYLSDLALALGATSEALLGRLAALSDARAALLRTTAGVSYTAQISPALEYGRDLTAAATSGAWDTDLDVSLSGTYRRDAVAIERARLAVATALERGRDQARDDLQRALLLLSGARLAERSRADDRAAAEDAAAAVDAALAAGAGADEVLPLHLAAERAANALERALADAVDAAGVVDQLGLNRTAPGSSVQVPDALATFADLAPGAIVARTMVVPTVEQHSRARLLARQLAVATAQSDAAAFGVLREVEVYGGYEHSGFEVEGRAALVTGVPTVGAGVTWSSGKDDVGFTVGVGATLRLTDATSRDAAATAAALARAREAYAAFLDGQVAAELNARAAAERDFEDLALERMHLALSAARLDAAVAASAGEREVARLSTAVRRAHDTTERAWQRYVRSLVTYLGIVDATWRADVLEER